MTTGAANESPIPRATLGEELAWSSWAVSLAAAGTQEGCVAAALQPTLREPPASATLGKGSGWQVGNVCLSHTHLWVPPLGLLPRKRCSVLLVARACGAVTVMPSRGLPLLSFCCPAQPSLPQCPLACPPRCGWHPLAVGRVLPVWGQRSEGLGRTLSPGRPEGYCPWHAWASWGWQGGRQEEKHLPGSQGKIQGKAPSPGRNPRENTEVTTSAAQGLSWLTQDLPQHHPPSSGLGERVGQVNTSLAAWRHTNSPKPFKMGLMGDEK